MEEDRKAARPRLTRRRARLFKELADELRGEAERRARAVPDLFHISARQRERRRAFVEFADQLEQWMEDRQR